jgi:hypothetical protein
VREGEESSLKEKGQKQRAFVGPQRLKFRAQFFAIIFCGMT